MKWWLFIWNRKLYNTHFESYLQKVKPLLDVETQIYNKFNQMSGFLFLKQKCDLLGVLFCLFLVPWTAYRLTHYLSHFDVFIVFLFSLDTSIKSISLMEIVKSTLKTAKRFMATIGWPHIEKWKMFAQFNQLEYKCLCFNVWGVFSMFIQDMALVFDHLLHLNEWKTNWNQNFRKCTLVQTQINWFGIGVQYRRCVFDSFNSI